MSAFGKKVKTSKADLYYIRFLKGAKREEREKAEARTNARIISVMKYFNCDRETARLKLCEMALEGKLESIGHWDDEWGEHPLESATEVYKSFSHMTDMGRKSLKRKALYLSKSTLHPADSYFMRVRRRVSQLERGIPTASKDRRSGTENVSTAQIW